MSSSNNTDLTGGYVSLGADVNKLKRGEGEETKEGIVSQKLPELELEMENDQLVRLLDKYE